MLPYLRGVGKRFPAFDFACEHKGRFAALAFLASGLAVPPASAQMEIPTRFSVSPVGAATYSIPIQVPPGIAGVEPKLSLTYNSQAPNGPLGVGWSLGGLSVIRRCPQTLPQDNARTGVIYEATDRLCLDGKRLILESGSNLGVGSVYRLELDDVTKVAMVRETNGGVEREFFVAKTKSGLTLEYGKLGNSKIFSTLDYRGVISDSDFANWPQRPRAWALNKVSDTSGNAMDITYAQDMGSNGLSNGGFFPVRIDYTSHAASGLAATNRVVFNYDLDRIDPNLSFEAGRSIVNRSRLRSIATETGGVPVHTYELAYEIGPSSRRSRLASIRQVAPPTFGWLPTISITFPADPPANAVVTLRNAPSSDMCLSTCGIWQTLDVNGDGRMDLVHLKDNAGAVSVWTSNGDGTFSVSSFVSPDTSLTTGSWQVLDLNGDGHSDLLHLRNDSGGVSAWLSDGAGQFSVSSYTVSDLGLTSGSFQALDANGDGITDLVHHIPGFSGHTYRVWASNGDGTFTISPLQTLSPLPPGGHGGGRSFWLALDLNADGNMDMLSPGQFAFNAISNGNGTYRNVWYQGTSPTPGDTFLNVDVNGDGLVDLVNLRPGQTSQSLVSTGGMGTATGNGEVYALHGIRGFSFTNANDSGLGVGSWHVVDFNGDGLGDFFHAPGRTGSSQAYVWISDGKGAYTSIVAGSGDPSPNTGHWLSGDFTGDGVVDVIHMLDDSGRYTVWSMPRTSRDIPIRIAGGIGNDVAWTTTTLPKLLNRSSSPSYTRDLQRAGNVFTVIPAMAVVDSVDRSDGRGGTRRTSYSYDSARVERNGRGFLGFNWVQARDELTGIVERHYYRLDFPYLGLVAQTGRGTSSWNNLQHVVNEYACIDPAGPNAEAPSACTVSAGNRYLVYPSRTHSISRDVIGMVISNRELTTSNVDVYGNARTITEIVRDPIGGAVYATKSTTNSYWNDSARWHLGRVLVSTETSTGPDLPPPVRPGSGNLPPAPAPVMPIRPAALATIFSIVLDD